MQVVTTIGLDIAKSVFQVHGVDAAGPVVIRRKLRRRRSSGSSRSCPVSRRDRGMRLVAPLVAGTQRTRSQRPADAPAYVKPYVKRQKNDAADAEAICEAVTRANMRFVATKTPEQQSG